MKPIATGAFLLLAACGTSPNALTASDPLHVTVCELSAQAARFDGKLVELSAIVESDGLEHTTLTDDACRDTGVAPDTPAAIRDTPGAKALQQAIFSGRPGTIDKRISVSVRGVFHWHPKRIPSRVLTLESVTNVHVDLKPGEKG
jgi:hypothetical protein